MNIVGPAPGVCQHDAVRAIPPITLRAPRRRRREAGAVAELLTAAGLPIHVARRHRLGDWAYASNPGDIAGAPEAVLCAGEGEREVIEQARPDLIGRVWTTPDQDDAALWARRMAGRYRPPALSVPRRVSVIGYNLKFVRLICEHLARTPGAEVRIDEWPKFEVHDAAATAAAIEWAEVVVAEWCGPNAVLASRAKRPGQRLVVRLHRFELEREHWRNVDIDAVDAVVTVGDHYRSQVLEHTGWPADKVVVIPNYVDALQLDRPKRPDAPHAIGLLGAVPWRKRPDRALDVLAELRRHDPRYRLLIKSERPEAHRWIWEDPAHRAAFEAFFRYSASEPLVWQAAGPDVAGWFRSVGTILSVSEDESFHLAPAEGMASGTLPVVWNWPGSDGIYAERWIVSSIAEAAAAVLAAQSDRPGVAAAARRDIEPYRLEVVLAAWMQTLFG